MDLGRDITGFLPSCENMRTMRRILTGNGQRLAVLQYLPRYQEYLALGDEVCAALSFQDYYTIQFGSQPKDLDEDLLKGIVVKEKSDYNDMRCEGSKACDYTGKHSKDGNTISELA